MIKGLSHTLAVVVFLCLATAALAAEAGIVLRVTPGAWVERGEERLPLAMRSTVMAGDTLVTDVTGRVQVLFTDDTTISLGPDTRVAVTDFIFESKTEKPAFSTEMTKGMARFVTGKIVEQNRDGFKVVTPQATVGIRGTTFSVNVSGEGVTSVIGLDVTRAFPLSVTNIATGAMTPIDRSGMGVDATVSGNKSYEVPEGHFSQASAAVNGGGTESGASGGGAGPGGAAETGFAGPATAALVGKGETSEAGMASAASNISGTGGAAALTSALYGVEPAVAQNLAHSAGMTPLETMRAMTNMNMMQGMAGGPDHSNASGHYSGVLQGPVIGFPVGTFSFDATLNAGTGSITNTQMNAYITVTASQVGGPAPVSGGAFFVPVVVGSGNSLAGISAGSTGDMTGAFGAGNRVDGTWQLDTQGGAFHGDKN